MEPTTQERETSIQSWFDEFISGLKADEMMLLTDTAPKSKKKFYDTIINGKEVEMHKMARSSSSLHFIKGIVREFIKELGARKCVPLKLAMELSDSKILVWAEIKDDDEGTEDALIMAEAKVNAAYVEYGFHISTMIVEKGDNLKIPEHYHQVHPS